MPDSIFEPDGDSYLPTELARGPWDERALHAGATAALIVREIELTRPAGQLTRITIDLHRPAPVSPLRVELAQTTSGRQVQRIRAEVTAADRVVAVADTLFIRRLPLEIDAPTEVVTRPGEDLPAPPPPQPESVDLPKSPHIGFHNEGMDVRFTRGSFVEPGPATVWFRMRYPLLPAEEPSPAVRVMAAADFINGSSTFLSWEEFVFINPDLTVYLSRMPQGEWVALDAVTRPSSEGAGFAEAQLFDEEGPIGRAQQSLLLGPAV